MTSFKKLPEALADNRFTILVAGTTVCAAYFLSLVIRRITTSGSNSNSSNQNNTERPRRLLTDQSINTLNGAITEAHNQNGVVTGQPLVGPLPYRAITNYSNVDRARANWESLIDADQERRRRIARRNVDVLRRQINQECKRRQVRRQLKEAINEPSDVSMTGQNNESSSSSK